MIELENGIEEYFLQLDAPTDGSGSGKQIRVFLGYHRTDGGNANRLIAYYGDDIRYCAELKEWYIWDGVRWAPDTTMFIEELAKQTVKRIHAEVLKLTELGASKAEREKLSKWVFASEEQHKINGMIRSAQSDPRITVRASDFDANKWLINTPDGTIDLKTGEFRAGHNRDDLLTKVSRGRYRPDADGALYFNALFASLSVPQVIFFQRAWGSALEPSVKNKAMFIIYGRSNTRKSTCSEPPLYALGDYACTQNITTFIKTPKRGGAARPDIVSLEGVHVAYCEETPAGMVFDDATIKSLTSLARQRARTLWEKRERDIELIVAFFIETNELPRIDTSNADQAEAVFNRLYVITFLNPIAQDEIDPNIKDTLITEQEALDAVFTWVIDGYFDYVKNGLQPPESVKEASEDYQLKMNPLAEFFRDEVIADDDPLVKTLTRDLYAHFKNVSDPDVQKLVKNKTRFGIDFAKLAKSKGFESRRITEGTVWLGLRIRDWNDEGNTNKVQNKEPDTMTLKGPFCAISPMGNTSYRDIIKKHDFSVIVSYNGDNAITDSETEINDPDTSDNDILAKTYDEKTEHDLHTVRSDEIKEGEDNYAVEPLREADFNGCGTRKARVVGRQR